jgi:DNA-directed RNA polymerase subunit M/transcription elongation factor TFIIS
MTEQARTGRASELTSQTICRLQCIEFEVFFRYCLETTLGEKLVNKAPGAVVQDYEARMQQVRQLAEKHRAKRQKSPTQSDEQDQTEDEADETPTIESIRIGCPKCKSTVELPASSRGQCARCDRCGVRFMVPQLQTAPGMPAVIPPANMVGIRCPKCQEMLMFPEASRGKKEKCGKCGVIFLIPPRKPPVPVPVK